MTIGGLVVTFTRHTESSFLFLFFVVNDRQTEKTLGGLAVNLTREAKL
jgi:hypothetical protein